MNYFTRMIRYGKIWRDVPSKLDKIQEALGRIESRQIMQLEPSEFGEAEFKVYSQWGEDGIIQHLINHVPITNTCFIEFGVENYLESNTRFLLVNNNWTGLVLDGSAENIAYIKNDMSVSYAHNLLSEAVFITRENINDIITRNGISGDIGILSVDIDGNDYWVWEAITCISPRIVICEYNSLFGSEAKVSTPYRPAFYRGAAHYSNVYYGASIAAFEYLAGKKGYKMVASNSVGNNVFFVREDVSGAFKRVVSEEVYQKAQFKEAKDKSGNLCYIDFEARRREVGSLEVVDVETNKMIRIKEIH